MGGKAEDEQQEEEEEEDEEDDRVLEREMVVVGWLGCGGWWAGLAWSEWDLERSSLGELAGDGVQAEADRSGWGCCGWGRAAVFLWGGVVGGESEREWSLVVIMAGWRSAGIAKCKKI